MDPSEEGFWLLIRQALLMMVDAVERFKLPKLGPTTAEIRAWYKQAGK
jgi:hypothetical protein